MTVAQKDLDLFQKGFPKDVKDDQQFLLQIASEMSKGRVESNVVEPTESEKRVAEAKDALRNAINATSALQKIIEQRHGNGADVKVTKQSEKAAIRRIFKKETDVITFSMYKQAIAKMRDYANKVKEHVLNEQL